MKNPREVIMDLVGCPQDKDGKICGACLMTVDKVVAQLEECYADKRKEIEGILNNPEKWMKWCDIKVYERCKELETVLEAWYAVFGTTQLTHASDRLAVAEKNAKKLEEYYKPEELLPKVDSQYQCEHVKEKVLRGNCV